jgi:hypothetical protein
MCGSSPGGVVDSDRDLVGIPLLYTGEGTREEEGQNEDTGEEHVEWDPQLSTSGGQEHLSVAELTETVCRTYMQDKHDVSGCLVGDPYLED